ncbi:MAG: hypothetical protein HY736_00025 [Verrucomicrobia bacterium]|nr:hypothetical protein [Verrucomicrobiota bacterium]
MILVGKVSNGTVILPPDAYFPDGAEVEVRSVVAKGETTAPSSAWHFPEGRHLGGFGARAEDWRSVANAADAQAGM